MSSFLSTSTGMALVDLALMGVEVIIGSGTLTLCKLDVGLGDTGGGVAFCLMERDLFGGSAGGRIESFVMSLAGGSIDSE